MQKPSSGPFSGACWRATDRSIELASLHHRASRRSRTSGWTSPSHGCASSPGVSRCSPVSCSQPNACFATPTTGSSPSARRYLLSTVSGLLGQTVYELGRFEEAESLGLECKELATEDDIDTQTLWRCLLGKVVARKGSPGEGERLIREAIEMLAPTDDLPFQCAALARPGGGAGDRPGAAGARADARARAGTGPSEGKPRPGRADPAHAGRDVAGPRSRSAAHTGCVTAADRGRPISRCSTTLVVGG